MCKPRNMEGEIREGSILCSVMGKPAEAESDEFEGN